MAPDDYQMILLCKNGREDGYHQLISRYEGYVYTLCYHMTHKKEDALDLVQESFIKVLKSIGDFQINKPFKPWLRQITVNTCLNFLRGQSKLELSLQQPLEEGLTLEDVLATHEDPAQEVAWRDTEGLLWSAVDSLPHLYRLVIILRHREDMSYQDIADTTKLPLGTVKTYLNRARKLLRQKLATTYGWEVV